MTLVSSASVLVSGNIYILGTRSFMYKTSWFSWGGTSPYVTNLIETKGRIFRTIAEFYNHISLLVS